MNNYLNYDAKIRRFSETAKFLDLFFDSLEKYI